MAVPGFQEFMLPLLRLCSDGKAHTQKEAVAKLADEFGLSDADRSVLLASGQTRLFNRVAWARSYLKQAGLLESPSRGVSVITERGRGVLHESPAFFERLVVDLLVRMGYGGTRHDAGEAIGQSGDGGIDGIIKEDKLGLDTVCIQAKRWQASVGRPVVQAFAGSLEGRRARKGVLLTTSTFTKDAEDYVKAIEKRIVLIDGPELARLMIDHGVGVGEIATYTLSEINEEYFDQDVSSHAESEAVTS